MLTGVAIPAVFSAMLMLGVDKMHSVWLKEIRRQFRKLWIKGRKRGVSPEYDKCIEIATIGAIKELIQPA